MKKTIKSIFAIVLILAVLSGGFLFWHNREMNALSQKIYDEQAQEALMSQRIQDIQEQLASSEEEKEGLLQRIDEMLAVETPVFDSAAIAEEILEIGELATVEYRYTNVGTIDSVKTFSFVSWTVPFSGKTAVVTMDGAIKVGIDVSQVSVSSDEVTKTISVTLPGATVLSNELFEETMAVYVEEDSLFSDITLDDSSSIRTEIKDKALQNAIDNGLLDQAREKAEEIIRYLIEAVPGVKGTYTIAFH